MLEIREQLKVTIIKIEQPKPIVDGYYIFAIAPSDGLPTLTSLNDILSLKNGQWGVVYNYSSAPAVIYDLDDKHYAKNSNGWGLISGLIGKTTGNDYTNNTIPTSGEVRSDLTEALLAIPSLPDVELATTANDSLSGLAARDGVTPTAGTPILVKSQTSLESNIVYIADS